MWKKFRLWIQRRFQYRGKFLPRTYHLSGEEFLLRMVDSNDVKSLLDIQRLVYMEKVPWTRSAFLAEFYSPHVHLYLGIETKEKLVGFMGVRISYEDAHITNIAIAPNYQRKGLGSIFITEAELFAKRNGCKQMSLEVRRDNRGAQSLYRKRGFQSIRILPNYYTEIKEDAIEMIKVIA